MRVACRLQGIQNLHQGSIGQVAVRAQKQGCFGMVAGAVCQRGRVDGGAATMKTISRTSMTSIKG